MYTSITRIGSSSSSCRGGDDKQEEKQNKERHLVCNSIRIEGDQCLMIYITIMTEGERESRGNAREEGEVVQVIYR